MDYEKLHKDTINKLQQMVNSGKITVEIARGICADFVPESEDEKIRKAIYNCVKWFGFDSCFFKDVSQEECLAWLEKQCGHAKFINGIQVGDKVTRNEDGVLVNLSQLNRVAKKDEKQGEQSPAWSEEDEMMINYITIDIEELIEQNAYDVTQLRKEIDWLKSLKEKVQPQPKQECEYAQKKEPVSEDLENAAYKYGEELDQIVGSYDDDDSSVGDYAQEAFKAGAKWQKEQIMKDATGAIVAVDAGGYPYVDKHIELYDYDKDVPLAKEGDKYKVVLIKE